MNSDNLATAACPRLVNPRLLYRMQPVCRQPLYGGEIGVAQRTDAELADAGWRTIEPHGAGTALRNATPLLGSHKTEMIVQCPQKGSIWINTAEVSLYPVDCQRHVSLTIRCLGILFETPLHWRKEYRLQSPHRVDTVPLWANLARLGTPTYVPAAAKRNLRGAVRAILKVTQYPKQPNSLCGHATLALYSATSTISSTRGTLRRGPARSILIRSSAG